METKTCRVCERELPESAFMLTKGGVLMSVCRECRTSALRENKAAKRAQMGGGKPAPFSDPDFDGREPREVLLMMGRAKKWLESRGFTIQLSGEYRKVEIKKVKFE